MGATEFTGLAAFVLFLGFTLQLSPYRRTQFDYSRAAIQKTILSGFILWFLSCLLLFAYDHCQWLIDLENSTKWLFYIPKLITNIFYTNYSGVAYRASALAATVGFYFIIVYYVIFQLSVLFSGKRNEYRMRKKQYKSLKELVSSATPSQPGPGPRFAEVGGLNIEDEIKIIEGRNIPYQWIDLPLRRVFQSTLMDEDQKQAISITFLKIFSSSVQDQKGKSRAQKVELLIRSSWSNIKSLVLAPFYYQDIKRLTDMAWRNSEDMLYQLYKSQQSQGALIEYLEHHNIDNDQTEFLKVIDNNPQPQMVSVHMGNGRIYNGWVVNSTRPAVGAPEFTILPYSTKHRSKDKSRVVSITKYDKAVWHMPKMAIILPILAAVDGLIASNQRDERMLRALNDLKAWIGVTYYKYLYRSNGENYEVAELLKIHPDHARKFFKSIKITDVEMIHPYEINISEDLFEQVQLIKNESFPRFTNTYNRRGRINPNA